MRFLLALALFVSSANFGNAFVPMPSTSWVSSSSSFGRRPVVIGRNEHHGNKASSIFLQKNNDDKYDDNKENDMINDMIKGTQRLSIGDIFNKAIFGFGILFLVSSFILESFGYAYVVVDNHLAINTLDYRQFQTEVIKATKETKSLSNSI